MVPRNSLPRLALDTNRVRVTINGHELFVLYGLLPREVHFPNRLDHDDSIQTGLGNDVTIVCPVLLGATLEDNVSSLLGSDPILNCLRIRVSVGIVCVDVENSDTCQEAPNDALDVDARLVDFLFPSLNASLCLS